MPVQDLKDDLLRPVSDFWRDHVADWLDAVDERFLETLETDTWQPGVGHCLNAFAGGVRPKVVWLGESPYEGERRATGFSFCDGTADALFGNDDALTVPINKATSLRNVLKAWFRADGRLEPEQTSKDHIRAMCKDGLAQQLDQVFEQGIASGWLWLNAGLSIGGRLDKSAHVCGWRPFVSRAIAWASGEANATVVLLGESAKTYRSDAPAGRLVEATHPRNESFVEDGNVRTFLRCWTHLIHQ